MKHIFPYLLLLLLACPSCHGGKQKEVDGIAPEAGLLLHRADSLFGLFLRTSEGNADSLARSLTTDAGKAIQSLIDSATAIAPDYKPGYLRKINYLTASRRFKETARLLEEMSLKADSMMSAELFCLKALLADWQGDSLAARRDYLKADSAYSARLNASCDTVERRFLRLNKALNRSLMENDFTTIRKEIARLRQAMPEAAGQLFPEDVRTKEDYYRHLFGKPGG